MTAVRSESPSELLARLLLGDEQSALEAGRRSFERGLWSNAVELAKHWRVVPALSRRLSDLDLELEPVDAERLSAEVRRSAIQSALTCHRAAEALAVLERAELPAMVFKGVAAIGHLYRSPALRMLQDADLLVGEDDVRRAVELLQETGFEMELPIDLETWFRLLGERVYRDHEYVELRDGDGVALDLHWHVPFAGKAGLPVEELLQRRTDVPMASGVVSAGSPEDSLLLTAHHLVRDRLVPRVAVKDLIDLAGWFAMDGLNREVLTRRAAAVELLEPLVAMAAILVDFDAGSAAAKWLESTVLEDPHHAERLVAFFRLQLREGEVGKGLLGLSAMSLPMLRRFVASRWRSLRDAEYRAVFHHHDRALGRRKGDGLGRELSRLRPSRLRLLRAMARETRKLA
jgi:hypothetical protein